MRRARDQRLVGDPRGSSSPTARISRSTGSRSVSTWKVCIPPILGRAFALICVDIGFESLWLTLRTLLRRRDLLEADSSGEEANLGTILEREFRSSMQATVSATIALDAFYAAIKDRIVVPQDQMSAWRKNRTARWKQMAEVFRLAFGLSDRAFVEVRKLLKEAFKYRDWAIHPPAAQQDPVLRDDIHVDVEWRLVAFRYKNAATIVQMALALVNKMLKKEHLEPEALAKYCEGLRPAVDALIEAWSREYPSWPVVQLPKITE